MEKFIWEAFVCIVVQSKQGFHSISRIQYAINGDGNAIIAHLVYQFERADSYQAKSGNFKLRKEKGINEEKKRESNLSN